VKQVIGDGIIALFRAPSPIRTMGVRACYAALAMQSAMERYTDVARCTHGIEGRCTSSLHVKVKPPLLDCRP
jgi:class 3 adenylate cyclase